MADRIQEEGSSILHHQQYGLVRSHSAVDVVYKSVVRVRQSLEGGGSVGWAFWDIKGCFLNVRSAEVLARMEGCTPLRCWLSWLKRFMSQREFEVAWDGGIRGRGPATKAVCYGDPRFLHSSSLCSWPLNWKRWNVGEGGGGEGGNAVPVLCGRPPLWTI